ncbi:MAG: hypothetical protein AAGK01_10515 [Pseudomonadota bacterium]
MRLRFCLAGPALLILAACSSDETQDTPPPADQAEESASAESSGDPVEDGLSAPESETKDIALKQAEAGTDIPAPFQGVWDYERGSCAPESDLRMEIKDRSITFYESYGAVSDVRGDAGDTIVDLAMEGEGEKWKQSLRLSLVGEGAEQRLHTSDASKPKQPDELPRKRCT